MKIDWQRWSEVSMGAYNLPILYTSKFLSYVKMKLTELSAFLFTFIQANSETIIDDYTTCYLCIHMFSTKIVLYEDFIIMPSIIDKIKTEGYKTQILPKKKSKNSSLNFVFCSILEYFFISYDTNKILQKKTERLNISMP